MKILYVAKHNSGGNDDEGAITHSLRSLGHEVICIRIILSNPDMPHAGILPQHPRWAGFFADLRAVVIDEMHVYNRGVFGSHVANVIRRLKRVAHFYCAHPLFILASATIGNPRELAEKLIEHPITLIDNDGSARGPRHFLLYNPPLVDPALGLRRSSLLEAVRLTQDLLKHAIQSVVFARSRRSVEIILTYLQQSEIENRKSEIAKSIRGYRSGWVPPANVAGRAQTDPHPVRAVGAWLRTAAKSCNNCCSFCHDGAASLVAPGT